MYICLSCGKSTDGMLCAACDSLEAAEARGRLETAVAEVERAANRAMALPENVRGPLLNRVQIDRLKLALRLAATRC